MTRRRIAIVALVASAIIGGFVPTLVRWSEVGPIATAFWRLAIGSGLAFLILPARPGGPRALPGRNMRRGLAVCGLLFAADLATFHFAIGTTTVANASLLNNLAPVFAGGFAVLLGRPTGRRFWLGMALALVGVVLLFFPRLDRGSTEFAGLGAGLLSALFFAGYLLVVQQLRETFSTVAVVAWTGLASSVVLLPAAWVAGERILPITTDGWVVVLALAVVAHGIGQALMIYALAWLTGHEAGAGILIQVIVVAGLGAILFGEPIGVAMVLGAGAVLSGVFIATVRPVRR